MNMLWYLIRPFYVVGLVPVVLLCAIALSSSDRDYEVTTAILLCSFLYFALGFLVLWALPNWFKKRLMSQVAKFVPDFNVDFEAVSALFNRYIGFDHSTKKVVYVDVSDGTRALLDFPDVNSWEVATLRGKPASLKLSTSLIALPSIAVSFDSRQSTELMAKLNASFG